MKILIILLVVLASCNTVKEVVKTVNVVDSTAVKTRDSLFLHVQELIQTHERQLQEARNTGVVFVDDCDTIFLDKEIDCNTDSLLKLIRAKNNKIKILADGSIEAEGKIKSVYSNLEKTEMEKDDLLFVNNKLTMVNDSLTTELSKRDTSASKNVKRSWSWWYLIFFLLGNATMYLLFRYKIFKNVVA